MCTTDGRASTEYRHRSVFPGIDSRRYHVVYPQRDDRPDARPCEPNDHQLDGESGHFLVLAGGAVVPDIRAPRVVFRVDCLLDIHPRTEALTNP
jgi:hypothetical protein